VDSVIRVFDLREQYINKLRYILGTYDWDTLFYEDKYGVDDIDWIYGRFLAAVHSFISMCIPCKLVAVGPRDPDFVNSTCQTHVAEEASSA